VASFSSLQPGRGTEAQSILIFPVFPVCFSQLYLHSWPQTEKWQKVISGRAVGQEGVASSRLQYGSLKTARYRNYYLCLHFGLRNRSAHLVIGKKKYHLENWCNIPAVWFERKRKTGLQWQGALRYIARANPFETMLFSVGNDLQILASLSTYQNFGPISVLMVIRW